MLDDELDCSFNQISTLNSNNSTNAGTKIQYVYDSRTSVAQTITSQIGSKVTGLAAQGGTNSNIGNNPNVNTNTSLPNTNPKAAALTAGNSTLKITSFTYTPFGEQLGKVGNEKVTGFGFNGKYYDGTTGMLNLRARQYEPMMNRFSQKDLLRGTLEHPLSQNRYGFVINGPLSLIDPSGKSVVLLGFSAYTGFKALLAALATYVVADKTIKTILSTNTITPSSYKMSFSPTILTQRFRIIDGLAQVNAAKNKPNVNEDIDANCVPSEAASTTSDESSSSDSGNENKDNKGEKTKSLALLLSYHC